MDVNSGTGAVTWGAAAGGYFLQTSVAGTIRTIIDANGMSIGTGVTPTVGFDVSAEVKFTAGGAARDFDLNDYDSLKIRHSSGSTVLSLLGKMDLISTGNNSLNFIVSSAIRAGISVDAGTGEVRYNAAAGGYFPTFYSNNAEAFRVNSAGEVMIGSTSDHGSEKLQVTGDAYISGTINTATWGGATVTVPFGGTGIATTTAYGLLAGGTTSTGAFQNAGTGTTGQIYKSGGASALGTWTDQKDLETTGAWVKINFIEDANYTITSTDHVIEYSALSAGRTVTLPDAAANIRRVYIVKDGAGNAATFNITIQRAGSNTIDGATSYVINSNGGAVEFYSNGSHWRVFAKN